MMNNLDFNVLIKCTTEFNNHHHDFGGIANTIKLGLGFIDWF